MVRSRVLSLASLLCLVQLSGLAGETPLIHLQTDRPAYRLGETVWYRVHGKAEVPLVVELRGEGGELIAHEPDGAPLAGKLLVGRGAPGAGRGRACGSPEGESFTSFPWRSTTSTSPSSTST